MPKPTCNAVNNNGSQPSNNGEPQPNSNAARKPPLPRKTLSVEHLAAVAVAVAVLRAATHGRETPREAAFQAATRGRSTDVV